MMVCRDRSLQRQIIKSGLVIRFKYIPEENDYHIKIRLAGSLGFTYTFSFLKNRKWIHKVSVFWNIDSFRFSVGEEAYILLRKRKCVLEYIWEFGIAHSFSKKRPKLEQLMELNRRFIQNPLYYLSISIVYSSTERGTIFWNKKLS